MSNTRALKPAVKPLWAPLCSTPPRRHLDTSSIVLFQGPLWGGQKESGVRPSESHSPSRRTDMETMRRRWGRQRWRGSLLCTDEEGGEWKGAHTSQLDTRALRGVRGQSAWWWLFAGFFIAATTMTLWGRNPGGKLEKSLISCRFFCQIKVKRWVLTMKLMSATLHNNGAINLINVVLYICLLYSD